MESSRTLVLQDVVAELMAATGQSDELCKAFVKSLFTAVGDQLVANGEATLKGIGRFVVVDGNVQFEADAEAAAFVNGAFDCFEPMELADDFDGEEKPEEEPSDELPAEEEKQEPESEENEAETEEKSVEEEVLPPPVPNEEETKEEQTETSDESAVDSEDDEWQDEPVAPRGHRFLWGFVSGFATAAVLAAAAYFLVPAMLAPRAAKVAPTADSTTVADTVAADTLKPAEAVEEPHRDTVPQQEETATGKEQTFTVTNTAYLSNISRKFYGHYAFWIYIYLENKDVISDPDNLPVGATLKIPAPEKYGIDKNDPESIKRAEIKALELKKEE